MNNREEREWSILRLIQKGLDFLQIARQLHITLSQVERVANTAANIREEF
jgi:DNA-binding NarL/FixJ family response regulator